MKPQRAKYAAWLRTEVNEIDRVIDRSARVARIVHEVGFNRYVSLLHNRTDSHFSTGFIHAGSSRKMENNRAARRQEAPRSLAMITELS
jgi:hypothetical protein